MQMDRYSKLVLTVIAVALTALAVGQFILPQPAEAQGQIGGGGYQMTMLPSGSGVWVMAPSGQVWVCAGAVAPDNCRLIGATR